LSADPSVSHCDWAKGNRRDIHELLSQAFWNILAMTRFTSRIIIPIATSSEIEDRLHPLDDSFWSLLIGSSTTATSLRVATSRTISAASVTHRSHKCSVFDCRPMCSIFHSATGGQYCVVLPGKACERPHGLAHECDPNRIRVSQQCAGCVIGAVPDGLRH
jgi:hypothetical protein